MTLLVLLPGCNRKDPINLEITKRENLNQNWLFSRHGHDQWLPATIPGTIHLDLLANGIIEEPFAADNETKQQWIEHENWIYKTEFRLSREFIENQCIALVFEGLDTYAHIFLNGMRVLEADNMFREWRIDAKEYLREGNNILEVQLLSAYAEGLKYLKKFPYILVADSDKGEFKTSVFTRKAPYHYGWDWAPRFVTSGIWKPVYLEAWNNTRIADVRYDLVSLRESQASIRVEIEIECQQDEKIWLRVKDREGRVYKKKKVTAKPGTNRYDLEFSLRNPQLWWPNGLGEPFLYEFIAELENGRNTQANTTKFGIRTIELVQEPDSIGSSFMFRVNGVPVFMKGANYIPPDMFLPRVDESHYRKMLQLAAEANMNMLRVWGGGVYADEAFYNLCDEYGILVWQDFMFACSFYPWDNQFLENVKHEITHQVKRLRNHACMALWCGNNEISEAWHHWGYQSKYRWSGADSAAIWQGYLKLFEELIPNTLSTLDPGRPYWPSSPLHGWGTPKSLTKGDSHYWGVWWGEQPFEIYEQKIPRFASEYGFQSFLNSKTLEEYIPQSEWQVTNPAIKSHQKHPRGFELIDLYMKRQLHAPKTFEDYFYLSQILQAEGMRKAIEAHRRNMPYCMGSLYWQLNDCWPAVSWSGIDYRLNPKALQFVAGRAFSPKILSFEAREDKLSCYLVADHGYGGSDTLHLTLWDLTGKLYWEQHKIVEFGENAATLVYSLDKKFLLTFGEPNHLVLCANIGETSANHYFVTDKNLCLREPGFEFKLTVKNGTQILRLTAMRAARYIHLSTTRQEAKFSHNFFDLAPGQTVEVEIKSARLLPPEGLIIRSLFDYQ